MFTEKTSERMENAILPFCIPKGVELKQLADVFCEYLAETPEDADRPADRLIFSAMVKVWPCKATLAR